MLSYPNIDPVALHLGPLKIHWYGIMYLVAFGSAWWLGLRRAARADSGWHKEHIADVVFYGALGTVLGGRIGYTLFYGLDGFLANPLSIFYIWQGGMSFHGGLLGVLAAMWLFGHRTQRSFFQVTDFIAPLVPIGIAAVRLADDFGCSLIGIQYQQGLKDLMPYAKGVSAKSNVFDEQGNEVNSDYRKMMQIVLDHGYHGHVGVEFEGEIPEPEGIIKTRDLLLKIREELS